ncbi:hypothetical protein M0804_005101 [Polistes exclamans]|nr:hypothetical protein M0804_005101 [Polistes exclamans]
MPGFLKSKDAQQASAGNPVPLVNISVVEGKQVELPCDITPPGEDTLHMVFWFKDEAGVPLYTSKSRTNSAVLFPVKPGRGDLGDSSLDYDGVETGQGSCPSLVSSRSQYHRVNSCGLSAITSGATVAVIITAAVYRIRYRISADDGTIK